MNFSNLVIICGYAAQGSESEVCMVMMRAACVIFSAMELGVLCCAFPCTVLRSKKSNI